ncbi:hypothetical protein Indivirus_1_17 [Indivirus ILV1]|uniref:Uncharacterized protein n=1 Tax=Indivirus ILV1 TaxID=1977633 RepID=A0A1V0SCN6_9VIRU|nr:hypothetical protein Indivirus_1_17 [Indivirus ILV1]
MKSSKRGRGRPRKNQIITIQNKSATSKETSNKKEETHDEIILHLPISLKDIKDIPNNEKKESISDNTQNQNIFTINDIQSESSSNSSYEVNDAYVFDLKEKIKEQEKCINQLSKELDEYKSMINDSLVSGTNNKKVTKMDINLINSKTGIPIIVEKTNIACWWCSYNFDNPPCFLPENYTNNTFYVFGCFCTFNCACSYNLNINDSSVWNRYSLLKKLYGIIYKEECNILMAPPREVFEKFGGVLKYEDFRKNCNKYIKDYRFIMPPMTSIVPLIEEGYIDTSKISLSLADINKRTSIKRTKPLPNTKNNLFETFGVK